MRDEMAEAHRRDYARASRMRAIRDALQDAETAGDLRGWNLSDGLRLREWAQKEIDHVVATWN